MREDFAERLCNALDEHNNLLEIQNDLLERIAEALEQQSKKEAKLQLSKEENFHEQL